MARTFTNRERAARYLAYTALGASMGTIAALAQNSLSKGGWSLSLIGGVLGAGFVFAADGLPRFREANRPAAPRAGEANDGSDPIPRSGSDPHEASADSQASADDSAMAAAGRTLPQAAPALKRQEPATKPDLPKQKAPSPKKPHLAKAIKGPLPEHPPQAPAKDSDQHHMQR
jgi:hypothetical protein